MPTRPTATAVQGILNNNYDQSTDLAPFIESAASLYDSVIGVTAAGAAYTDAKAEIIQRWLSAHFYSITDAIANSDSVGGISSSIQQNLDKGLEQTVYGQMAIRLDTSNALADSNRIDDRRTVTVFWAGRKPCPTYPLPYE